MWERTNHVVPGRDGCRVPLPWTRGGASHGYSTTGRTWLPQPEGWGEYSPEAQEGREGSTLTLYRRAIALRRERRLGLGSVEWLQADPGVLLLRNGRTGVALNTNEHPVTIEGACELLITSWYPADRGGTGAVVLPPNGACWLEMPTGGPDGGDPR